MATIIAFPRATTPRRTSSADYSFLCNMTLAALQSSAVQAPDPHKLAEMLRSIADDLDRLRA